MLAGVTNNSMLKARCFKVSQTLTKLTVLFSRCQDRLNLIYPRFIHKDLIYFLCEDISHALTFSTALEVILAA